jgi:hypothetical protein
MGKIGLPFIDSDLLYRGSTVLVFIKQDKNDMKFPPPHKYLSDSIDLTRKK